MASNGGTKHSQEVIKLPDRTVGYKGEKVIPKRNKKKEMLLNWTSSNRLVGSKRVRGRLHQDLGEKG